MGQALREAKQATRQDQAIDEMTTRATKTRARTPPTSREADAPAAASAKGKKSAESRSFRALLEPDHTSLKWIIVRVPFNIAETWTGMRRLRVRGEINGFPFRTSLFPTAGGRPGHIVLVNKRMQTAAGVRVGMEADFILEPDLEERSAELPEELIAAFEGDKTLLRFAQSLSESTRREIGKWIAGVKGEDSRRRRCEQMAERLMQTMEGERETPPVLGTLLAKSAKARAGWQAMSPLQRRSHLLGIFYYQTPEARTRRAQKAVDDAIRIAGQD